MAVAMSLFRRYLKTSNVILIAGGVIALSMLSRVLGFFSQIVVTAVMGTSSEADTFYFANSVMLIASSLISGVFPQILIPMYVSKKIVGGLETADDFFSGILTFSAIFLALVGLGLFLAGPLAVGGIGKFPAGVEPTAAKVFMAATPLVLIMGVLQMLMALHDAEKRFHNPVLMSILHSGIFLAAVLVFWPSWRVYSLVFGLLISSTVQCLILFFRLRAYGHKVRFFIRIHSEDIKRVARLSWPLLLSQILAFFWVTMTRGFATTLPSGSLAALSYADILKGIFISSFVLPVATMMFPHFSERISRKGAGSGWADLQESILVLWYVSMPVFSVFVVLGVPLVGTLFQRGAFDAHSTLLTASALTFYSAGLLAEVPLYLTSRYYLSMGETVLPLSWGIPSSLLHVTAAYLLKDVLFHDGIALAYSISMIFSFLIGLTVLKVRLRKAFSRRFVHCAFKIFLSGLLMMASIKAALMIMPSGMSKGQVGKMLLLGIPALLGLMVYYKSGEYLGLIRKMPTLRKTRLLLREKTRPLIRYWTS